MTEEEFQEKIPEWISSDKASWNHITYLAYFCHKYEKTNGLKFRLVRARKGPTMGKEASDFAKLFKAFAPENYSTLSSLDKKTIRTEISWKIYNYINWIFDFKFRMKLGSVNGTRLFLVPSLLVEFERMYLAHKKKKDSSSKMEQFVKWCKEEAPSIFDYHQVDSVKDLLVLKKYACSYNLESSCTEMLVIEKAEEMGLI